MRSIRRAALAVAILGTTGCARCAADDVGAGVARLTIRHVAAVATLVAEDAVCGFAGEVARAAATVQGAPGEIGTVTTTVSGCVIDAGLDRVVSSDCRGEVVRAAGRVTVTATRTVTGRLTGDPQSPVVPSSADAVVVELVDATFDDFIVTTTSSSDALRIVQGSLRATVHPRLATSASTGACAVPTPNARFADVRYGPAVVIVETADGAHEVEIAGSDVTAQAGQGPGGENAIAGTVTVFGEEVDVAGDGALDPGYDAVAFRDAYACTEDLVAPDAFTCADPRQQLADGAARLSVRMLAAATRLFDGDAACGFSSAAVRQGATASGVVGGDGALTFTMADCLITLPEPIEVSIDCLGRATTLQGALRASGTKTIAGRLTGDPQAPVIPDSDTPAAFALSIEMTDARVARSADANALRASSGRLVGSLAPRAARSSAERVCTVPSPHATASVQWEDAELHVQSAAGSFALQVDDAELAAVNGVVGAAANLLAGTMVVDGAALIVPSDGAGLDPAYSRPLFEAAWQCDPALSQPVSFSCGLDEALAAGAAALSMRTLAVVAGLVDADESCGFSSPGVAAGATLTGGSVPVAGDDDVTATLDLGDGCTITLPSDTVVATDCAGATTTVSGSVTVTGTKRATGFFTGDPAAPIVPTGRAPVSFDLALQPDELAVRSSTSSSHLVVHGGTLQGTLAPRTALDPTTGACSIATPNAAFTAVRWTDGDATLVQDGRAYTLAIDASDLAAVAGALDDAQNELTGSIRVDGVDHDELALPLDPAYDQAAIDAATACVAVPAPLEEACSFRRVLGDAAARLLVKATATAARVVDGNEVCGFAAPAVAGAPAATGSPGGPGALTFQVGAGCASGFATDTVIAADCAGARTHAAGAVVVDGAATKTVTGFLTGDATAPIFPVAATAATLTFAGLRMTSWSAYDEAPDGSIPARAVIDGTVQATLRPIAGVSESASAAAAAATGGAIAAVYAHPTPVAAVQGLALSDGVMTLVLGGKTFRVSIQSAALEAGAGAWTGDAAVPAFANAITGTIVVDGETVTVSPGLVAGYDQAAFDATYFDATGACAGDSSSPVPP